MQRFFSKINLCSEESNTSYVTQEREWVYVPEVITVGDERADYNRMQLVGDTFWITYPTLKKTLDERVKFAIARDRFTWDDVNVALKLVPDATPFFSVEDDEVSVIQNSIQLYLNENK